MTLDTIDDKVADVIAKDSMITESARVAAETQVAQSLDDAGVMRYRDLDVKPVTDSYTITAEQSFDNLAAKLKMENISEYTLRSFLTDSSMFYWCVIAPKSWSNYTQQYSSSIEDIVKAINDIEDEGVEDSNKVVDNYLYLYRTQYIDIRYANADKTLMDRTNSNFYWQAVHVYKKKDNDGNHNIVSYSLLPLYLTDDDLIKLKFLSKTNKNKSVTGSKKEVTVGADSVTYYLENSDGPAASGYYRNSLDTLVNSYSYNIVRNFFTESGDIGPIFVRDESGDGVSDLNEEFFDLTITDGQPSWKIKDSINGLPTEADIDTDGKLKRSIITDTVTYLTNSGKGDTKQIMLFCVADSGSNYIFDEYVWYGGRVQKLNHQTEVKYTEQSKSLNVVYPFGQSTLTTADEIDSYLYTVSNTTETVTVAEAIDEQKAGATILMVNGDNLREQYGAQVIASTSWNVNDGYAVVPESVIEAYNKDSISSTMTGWYILRDALYDVAAKHYRDEEFLIKFFYSRLAQLIEETSIRLADLNIITGDQLEQYVNLTQKANMFQSITNYATLGIKPTFLDPLFYPYQDSSSEAELPVAVIPLTKYVHDYYFDVVGEPTVQIPITGQLLYEKLFRLLSLITGGAGNILESTDIITSTWYLDFDSWKLLPQATIDTVGTYMLFNESNLENFYSEEVYNRVYLTKSNQYLTYLIDTPRIARLVDVVFSRIGGWKQVLGIVDALPYGSKTFAECKELMDLYESGKADEAIEAEISKIKQERVRFQQAFMSNSGDLSNYIESNNIKPLQPKFYIISISDYQDYVAPQAAITETVITGSTKVPVDRATAISEDSTKGRYLQNYKNLMLFLVDKSVKINSSNELQKVYTNTYKVFHWSPSLNDYTQLEDITKVTVGVNLPTILPSDSRGRTLAGDLANAIESKATALETKFDSKLDARDVEFKRTLNDGTIFTSDKMRGVVDSFDEDGTLNSDLMVLPTDYNIIRDNVLSLKESTTEMISKFNDQISNMNALKVDLASVREKVVTGKGDVTTISDQTEFKYIDVMENGTITDSITKPTIATITTNFSNRARELSDLKISK